MSAPIAPVQKKAHWQLTPHPIRQCWKKKHKGNSHYVGKGTKRYSETEYQRAWTEWEAKLAEIEKQENATRFAKASPRILQMIARNEYPDPDEMAEYGIVLGPEYTAIERRRNAEGKNFRLTAKELDYLIKTSGVQGEDQSTAAVVPDNTIGTLADKFLTHKAGQARKGERSGGRYANLRSYVYKFRDFAGADTDVEKFNAAATLADYYEDVSELIDREEMGTTTASDRMQIARQFVRWLWERSAIEDLPRNLDSKDLTFSRTVGNVAPMPHAVLRRRVKAATGRMKLELLLMANCGMYQKDCADLLHTEINWQAGTITRKRSKRTKGKEKNMPTVTYYLWPSTLEQLREHATNDGPNALANRNGGVSVRTEVREDGSVDRIDNAASSYGRLQNTLAKDYAEEIEKMKPVEIKARIEAGELELGEDGKSQMRRWGMKHIRKTGATAVGNAHLYSRFAQYFLGQAPKNVADTNYVQPSAEQFSECLKWLGKELDLYTTDKVKPPDPEPATAKWRNFDQRKT
jgi:hypothetical protein